VPDPLSTVRATRTIPESVFIYLYFFDLCLKMVKLPVAVPESSLHQFVHQESFPELVVVVGRVIVELAFGRQILEVFALATDFFLF